MIPKLKDGVIFHINDDILCSDCVNDLLRSRSFSVYTEWKFEKAWIDLCQPLSICIGDVWYWLTQFGWVGSDQLEDLHYSVASKH